MPNGTSRVYLARMVQPPRRRYRNPPLLEAVLEFQFHPGGDWSDAVAANFGERLHGYPHEETLPTPAPGDSAGDNDTPVRRYWREDRGVAVTAGRGLLAVSAVPPRMAEGHTWETLRDTALRFAELYVETVNPGRLRLGGLRYVNALRVDPKAFQLSDYVNSGTGLIPDVIVGEVNPFTFRLERTTQQGEGWVTREALTLSAIAFGEGGRLILDVDQVTAWESDVDEPSAAVEAYEAMHAAVHEVFVVLIRPEILETFEPVEPLGEVRR